MDHTQICTLAYETPLDDKETTKRDVEAYDLISKYFAMESAGFLQDHNVLKEDELVHQRFLQTIVYEPNPFPSPEQPPGQYIVALPWKTDGPIPDVNFGQAIGRMRSTLKTLRNKPELMKKYNQIMLDKLKQGIL